MLVVYASLLLLVLAALEIPLAVAFAARDTQSVFIDQLNDEGKILLGGPIGDVDGQHVVLVVRASSEDEARALFADDL